METIQPDEIGRLARGRMGLILGPGLSLYPGSLSDLSKELATQHQVPQGPTYLKTADAALEKGIEATAIRETIRSFVAAQKPSTLLTQLCKAKWAAVLSAALDTYFDERLRQEYSRRVVAPAVTTVADLATVPPPRSLPVFRLLGVAGRENLAYSTTSYIKQRIAWRRCLGTFSDCVKGNPVLCLGMADCPDIMLDLLAELVGTPHGTPRAILLLTEDPLCQNTHLQQILESHTTVMQVPGTVGDIARAAAHQEKAGYTPWLPFGPDDDQPFAELRPYSDLAVVVNEHLETTTKIAEQDRLFDLLFSPSVSRWDPFVHNLDFRRTLLGKLSSDLASLISDKDVGDVACVVHGGSASGKTTLLKRLALEIARAGDLTLWFKPWFYQDNNRTLDELFRKAAKGTGARRPIVAFMDDPLGYGSLSAKQIVIAARNAGVQLLLVVGVRNSDWMTQDRDGITGSCPVMIEEELPDSLDDKEWEELPDYLVKLGIAADRSEAETRIRSQETRHARDTLSMLYWLLPQTKAHIASSIRDEFYRLGDVAALTQVILGSATRTTQLLKSAYEMVAVADCFGAPLPIEVLVSALGVRYDEWLHAGRSDGPAWGLLYSEDSDEGDTVCYRTRNSVVTRVIIEAINGGSLGHSGELRVMSELLRACTGSQAAYREFCVRVLVPHDGIERLEFADGLRLYEDALAALPYPDKTLMHHKGLWIKNKGKDPVQASGVLSEALITPVYPYAERGEADEHIHTSLAATGLDAINQGTVAIEEGKAIVLEHLEKARSQDFFNVRRVHVQANLMVRLADKFHNDQTPDIFELINRAVADVDRTLRIITSPLDQRRHAANDVKMLEAARDQILAKVRKPDALRQEADRIWAEFESQQGFVLAARQAYQHAVSRQKGGDFNKAFTYYKQCVDTVSKKGIQPLPGLSEVGLHIYYDWQVRRRMMSGGGDPTNWKFLRDTSASALQSASLTAEPFCKYVHALALAHLGAWPEAKAIFAEFRQSRLPRYVVWTPRDYLQYSGGGLRQVQGTMKPGASDSFVYVEELGTDFHASRDGNWPKEDETVHAYIRFSFGGVTAMDRIS